MLTGYWTDDQTTESVCDDSGGFPCACSQRASLPLDWQSHSLSSASGASGNHPGQRSERFRNFFPGALTYAGVLGNITFDLTTALADPVIGNANTALLSLTRLAVTAFAPANLVVSVTDTNQRDCAGIAGVVFGGIRQREDRQRKCHRLGIRHPTNAPLCAGISLNLGTSGRGVQR